MWYGADKAISDLEPLQEHDLMRFVQIAWETQHETSVDISDTMAVISEVSFLCTSHDHNTHGHKIWCGPTMQCSPCNVIDRCSHTCIFCKRCLGPHDHTLCVSPCGATCGPTLVLLVTFRCPVNVPCSFASICNTQEEHAC